MSVNNSNLNSNSINDIYNYTFTQIILVKV